MWWVERSCGYARTAGRPKRDVTHGPRWSLTANAALCARRSSGNCAGSYLRKDRAPSRTDGCEPRQGIVAHVVDRDELAAFLGPAAAFDHLDLTQLRRRKSWK